MPPTTSHASTWRTGILGLFAIALLVAAMPVRAQLPTFSDACPAELEATAHGDGTILLEIDADHDVMLYRNGSAVGQVNGSSHIDANVSAGVSYTYHITLLIGGQESPSCAEASATAQASASHDASGNSTGNATGNSTSNATGNASADGGAHAHARADASATLEACPASLRADAKSNGHVMLYVNASAAVDAVKVMRAEAGKEPVQVATLAGSGTHLDTDTEAQVAYTYSIVIVVDGQTSDVCDALEVTSVPVFPGFTAVLATGIAGIAYLVARRS